VLDEADKMMDMGFAPQIREILEKIPRKRQNLLFSATFPQKVQLIADEFLEFPVKVEVTPQSTKAETVEHYYYKTRNLKTKINLLQHVLKDPAFKKVMIFTRTKKSATNIYKFLNRMSEDEIRLIHANKSQNSRINAFNDFKNGDVRILVTTDVSARGLDIYKVSHVINFEVPRAHEEYVHRIGRTGRAKQTGIAISFANEAEELHLEEIEKIISEKITQRSLPRNVEVFELDSEESKQIAMEIDRIKRMKNPDFKGAFHDKKKKSRSIFNIKGRKRKKRR
jgi:ATP-dependent RNA helicase RhlE